MPESTAFSHGSDLIVVREVIDAASGRGNASEALQALDGIRRQLTGYIRLAEERMAALTRRRPGEEPVVADSDQPRTPEQLAHALDRIGQRADDEDDSLSTDPDDYPVF